MMFGLLLHKTNRHCDDRYFVFRQIEPVLSKNTKTEEKNYCWRYTWAGTEAGSMNKQIID